jgi:hypothetical protein
MKTNYEWLRRGLKIWVLIVCVESINGTIRNLFIAPITGEANARQISFFIAVSLILLITYVSLPWIQANSFNLLLTLGIIWVILTAIFEIVLGITLGYPLNRIIADYDASRGGMMGFGLFLLLLSPLIAKSLRNRLA